MKNVLIVIDVQNDFCEGGSLEVKGSSQIFPYIRKLKKEAKFDIIIHTVDMHPHNHVSFASTHNTYPFQTIEIGGQKQQLWPDHCVVGTKGCELSELYEISENEIEIQKGTLQKQDAYSGFGKPQHPTKLRQFLQNLNIKNIVFVGLALDFCVAKSAVDAKNQIKANIFVVREACKSIGAQSQKNTIEIFNSLNIKYVSCEDAIKIVNQ